MNGKILITGGAGYVGSALVPELLKKGYQVRVFDKLIFGDSGLKNVRDKIELIQGDILTPPTDLMRDVVTVIHLAGVSSQAKAAYRSPRYTDMMNHIGTEIIAKLAKSNGVTRFILASSCSIYCSYKHLPTTDAKLLNETDHIDIFNPYALSKRAAEETLLELQDKTFRPIMLRKGTLYGHSPKMRYDLVLNSFTKDAFRQKKIVVNSGGEIFRPMVDIQDAIAAYIATMEMPIEKVGGQIFNILYRNEKIGDLAKEFQAIIKSEKGIDIALEIKPFEVVLNYRADNEKFKNVFGLTPKRALKDTILELWNHLERGYDYQNPIYYNDIWYQKAFDENFL